MWIVGGLTRGAGVLHRAGGVFSAINVDNVGSLFTVGGSSPTSLAAGNSADQIRVSSDRGATWQPASACWLPERATVLAANATPGLNDVCSGGGRTFIVGGGGTVLVSRDNVNWTSVRTGTFNFLNGCTVDDTGRLIAVGSGGTVLALTFPP
jgi:photosystem II stability/assembly factor-like uncharacterized protein